VIGKLKRPFSDEDTVTQHELIRCCTPMLDKLGDEAVIQFQYIQPDGSVLTVQEDAFGNRIFSDPDAIYGPCSAGYR